MHRAVAIVDTRLANVASLHAAFARLGVDTIPARTPTDVERADALVLPGVGAFEAAMDRLRALCIVDALRARIDEGRPTLCVCLGMQMLCDASDESPGVSGLAVLPARVERFTNAPRRTHFGWSVVDVPHDAPVMRPGFAYFAHSFRLAAAPSGWTASRARFGEPFVAALERGRVLACQFHPELSGDWGRALLARWLDRAGMTTAHTEEPACRR